MATTSKTSKSAKPTAAATLKTALKKASPAKVAAPKSVAPKPVAKPAAPPVGQPAKTPIVKPKISGEQRRHYIEVAAYFIAERTGFSVANALDHWTQAEAEIDRLLKEGKLNA